MNGADVSDVRDFDRIKAGRAACPTLTSGIGARFYSQGEAAWRPN